MWFIFDMDGTLLKDNHQISENNEVLVKQLISMGHKVGISTGRPFNTIAPTIPTIYDKLSYISAFNGALIHYENKVLENKVHFNNLSDFKKTTSIKFAITFGHEDNLHTDSHGPIIQDIVSRNNPKKIININDIDSIDCHLLVLIVEKPSELQKLTLQAKQFFKNYNVTSSTGIFVIISAKDASKAHALKVIDSNQKIFFFGDSGNDEDVFDLDHENLITIAPKNATKNIIAKADVVLTTTNNEGFILDEFFTFK